MHKERNISVYIFLASLQQRGYRCRHVRRTSANCRDDAATVETPDEGRGVPETVINLTRPNSTSAANIHRLFLPLYSSRVASRFTADSFKIHMQREGFAASTNFRHASNSICDISAPRLGAHLDMRISLKAHEQGVAMTTEFRIGPFVRHRFDDKSSHGIAW